MSPQSAEETPLPVPTSSEVQVEFHVLACGHGDTILLRLPADKWVLVDCNLPKAEGTRDKFFDFVRSRKIDRLEFVFLTHPDWDHFNGMHEVLEYFTSDGRSVGVFCDSGVNPQQVQAIFSKRAGGKAYARLQSLLDTLNEQRKIRFYEITDQHAPISPKGYRDIASLIPIAPSSTLKRQVTRSSLSRLADNPDAHCPANPFSVVLVLTGKHNNSELNVLLAADADADSLDLALNVWKGQMGEGKRRPAFDVIKVPHHGSIHSLLPGLYDMGIDGDRLAIISAGMRPALPDQRVIQSLLDRGWALLITTKRSGTIRPNLPMEMSNRGSLARQTSDCYDIQVNWSAGAGLRWVPAAARINHQDVSCYCSAASAGK